MASPRRVARGRRATGTRALHAGLGNLENAVQLVQQAVAGSPNHCCLSMMSELEPLWDESGFQEIVRPKG
jgi:hypothetical protein